MKNRKLKLVANVAGFDTLIAEVKIQNFADEIDTKDYTDLVCPDCGSKPQWKGGYVCPNDGRTFNHWSQLQRVLKGTKTALSTPRLLKEKEEAVAKLSYLNEAEFSSTYVDATRKDEGEKGVILTNANDASAKNLFKLLVAVEQLHYVIVLKWNDTTEQVIGLLTVSQSGRILIREIIPSNLVKQKETLCIDRNAVTSAEIEEAKVFIEHFIPKAVDETFTVSDYRAQWKEGQPTQPDEVKSKVNDLKAILQTIQTPTPKKKVK